MSKATTFLLGGAIGAGIALLYAPRVGSETRELVSDKVSSLWGEAVGSGLVPEEAQGAVDSAANLGKDLFDKASSAVTGAVKEVGENIAPATADKSDELREKIEAARQRIAAQVAANAEETKETPNAADTIAVDPVQEEAAEQTPTEQIPAE